MQIKKYEDKEGFQLVFHRVSKLIHLIRIRCSGWVRASRIINEFEKLKRVETEPCWH